MSRGILPWPPAVRRRRLDAPYPTRKPKTGPAPAELPCHVEPDWVFDMSSFSLLYPPLTSPKTGSAPAEPTSDPSEPPWTVPLTIESHHV